MKKLTIACSLMVPLLLGGCGSEDGDDCPYLCISECVDLLTDPLNCGGCNVLCPPGSTCEQGICTCPGTQEICGDACLDVMSDPQNCGGCDVLCTYDSQCTAGVCGEYLEPFGSLDVAFATGWIFDAALWTTDPDYVSTHWADGVPSKGAGFTGAVDSGESIPPTAAGATIAFALRYAANENYGDHIEIEQLSFEDDTYATIVSPKVQIVFPDDVIEPGTIEVDVDDLGEVSKPFIYVSLAVTSLSDCVLAVASGGTLTVSAAENTSETDGGSFDLTGTALPLYHPTNTPLGDISQAILSKGMLVCQLQ